MKLFMCTVLIWALKKPFEQEKLTDTYKQPPLKCSYNLVTFDWCFYV